MRGGIIRSFPPAAGAADHRERRRRRVLGDALRQVIIV
jgi:hypothetical protein